MVALSFHNPVTGDQERGHKVIPVSHTTTPGWSDSTYPPIPVAGWILYRAKIPLLTSFRTITKSLPFTDVTGQCLQHWNIGILDRPKIPSFTKRNLVRQANKWESNLLDYLFFSSRLGINYYNRNQHYWWSPVTTLGINITGDLQRHIELEQDLLENLWVSNCDDGTKIVTGDVQVSL